MNSTEKLIKTANETNGQIAQIDTVLSIKETKQLITEAVEESKHYTDITKRSIERKQRQENKLNVKTNRVSTFAFVIFGISIILTYMCAGTFDSGLETSKTIILLIIGIIGLVIASISLGWVMIKQNNFYKTQYIINYRLYEEPNRIYTYKTKATSDKKALKRFYKVIDLDPNKLGKCYSIKVTDEFGTEY